MNHLCDPLLPSYLECRCLKYSPASFRRGLIIDKARGNILKVDRHKYVQKACHGYEELLAQDRKAEYNHEVHSFTESNYVSLDTLFMVVDASLFSHLVDYKDKHPQLILKSYEQIHDDVRHCVDQCHIDGTIKNAVMKDPGRYIQFDDHLVPMMRRLRAEGKKVRRQYLIKQECGT
jgi:5'-nucleotidase